MKIGINLFSVRNLIQEENEFLKTAESLKDMGYSYLQYSGAPYDVERLKRVSEKTGMPICLTHVPFDRIVEKTDELMQEHSKFGCKYIGLGAMQVDKIADEKECKNMIAQLNTAGEKMLKNGFKFFYHHHQFEFYKHGNQTVFDYMIENAPFINFTVDTYWLQYGGVDILSTLDKLNGRINCVHLKDYKQKYDKESNTFTPTFCPLGEGVLDFKAIINKMKGLGVEYYLIEQDNAPDFLNPLEQVKISADYIKKEFN